MIDAPLYPIADAPIDTRALDFPRVVRTLEALKVGKAFVIPAAELTLEDGKWSTTAIGQRIHQAARRRGIKIQTAKVTGEIEGLRVKRVA